MKKIEMVDLGGQLERIKHEVDASIQRVLMNTNFIHGEEVTLFENELADWLGVKHVIGCANGTDALLLALMALNLKPKDEVLVPTFTYIATAEVIALLGLIPIFVDVVEDTFEVDLSHAARVLSPRAKAIVPVHLFGQCSKMEELMEFATANDLFVVEDTAQAIGSRYSFSNGSESFAGTIGDIGTTSFFPSKNLGCFGDGGALFTNDDELASKIRRISNHGQTKKYCHDEIGVNSRLDTIQAAVLRVKLPHLKGYCNSRAEAADFYDKAFANCKAIVVPHRSSTSTHVFHQYTLRIQNPYKRDDLKSFLAGKGIPSMIYYPLPLHRQKAYIQWNRGNVSFPVSELLCEEVLSLPMHTELKEDQLFYITRSVLDFFS